MLTRRLISIFISLAFLPALAWADPVDEVYDLPLAQRGQSVCIGVELHQKITATDDWSGDLDHPYKIVRDDGDEEAEIFPGHLFVPEEAFNTHVECTHMNVRPDCETEPDQCADCDGDGVPKCDGMCYFRFYFIIADCCVVAGAYDYALDWYFHEWLEDLLAGSIEVQGVSENCADTTQVCADSYGELFPYGDPLAGEGVILGDCGAEDSAEDDEDTGGCGCAARGDSPAPPLALLMLLAGLAVLCLGRRLC